jgi:hypothetical protein
MANKFVGGLPPLPKQAKAKAVKPVKVGAVKAAAGGLGGATESKGVQFGRPAHGIYSATPGSSSSWERLLDGALTVGAAFFKGGGVLGVAGVLSSLLGGKAAPLPLVQFSLPGVQNQTVTEGGGAVSSATTYGVAPVVAAVQSSADLVEAVRSSLYTSGRLNDAIAEL